MLISCSPKPASWVVVRRCGGGGGGGGRRRPCSISCYSFVLSRVDWNSWVWLGISECRHGLICQMSAFSLSAFSPFLDWMSPRKCEPLLLTLIVINLFERVNGMHSCIVWFGIPVETYLNGTKVGGLKKKCSPPFLELKTPLKPPPAPPNFVIDAPTRRSGASWMHWSCIIHSELKIVKHDRRSGLTTMIACTESLAVMTAFLFWHTWKLSEVWSAFCVCNSCIESLKDIMWNYLLYIILLFENQTVLWLASNRIFVGIQSAVYKNYNPYKRNIMRYILALASSY